MGSLAPPCMGTEGPTGGSSMAPTEYAGHFRVAPPDMPPRLTSGGAGGELAVLMQGLMAAQANDSGWPTFNGKYVEHPWFQKE